MIFIDRRVGSRELMRYLPTGEAQLVHLEFGDAMFLGRGPEEYPVHVGIERKTIDDLVCSLNEGRFQGHQLPGLLRDYHVVYLIVEGRYRANPDSGLLQVPNGKRGEWADRDFGIANWRVRELHGALTTFETRYNVRWRRSFNRQETAEIVRDLHHWWTDKAYEAHRSAQALDFSGEPLVPASTLRRVAAQLPLIGWKRSGAVADHFRSIHSMVNAPETEWRDIDGIGKKIASGVVQEIWRQK